MDFFKIIYDLITSLIKLLKYLTPLFTVIALYFTWSSNREVRKEYIESLDPLLSFKILSENNKLMLKIKNTGKSQATNITVDLLELKNNGDEKIERSNYLDDEFMLYPEEEICSFIAFSGKNTSTSVFPFLKINVRYKKGNTHKIESYKRTVHFTESTNLMPLEMIMNEGLNSISNKLNEISYSNNRMANYLEGRWLLKEDELNVAPHNSLYKDIFDAIHSEERNEETPRNGRDRNGKLNIPDDEKNEKD